MHACYNRIHGAIKPIFRSFYYSYYYRFLYHNNPDDTADHLYGACGDNREGADYLAGSSFANFAITFYFDTCNHNDTDAYYDHSANLCSGYSHKTCYDTDACHY